MGKADGFQKSGETADGANQSFHLDFFPQVETVIGPQNLSRLPGGKDDRQHAEMKRLFQIEASPQFGGHERVQRFSGSPAAKEVYSGAAEFASAGAGKNELYSPFLFDEQVGYFEQCRKFLNFIDHNTGDVGPGGNQFAQAFRPGRERPHGFRIKQVNPESIGEKETRQPGFSGSARTEQEIVILR